MKTYLLYTIFVLCLVAVVLYIPQQVSWFMGGFFAGAFFVFGLWLIGAIGEYYHNEDL